MGNERLCVVVLVVSMLVQIQPPLVGKATGRKQKLETADNSMSKR